MPVILIVLAWLAVSFAPPRPVNLRLHLHASGASSHDVERVSAAYRRGFYSNSSVTPPAETLHTSLPLDSATRARIGMTVVVDGSVRVTDNHAEVCLQLLNILAQPITATDTVRVDRDALDSALAVTGHNHAQLLTDRFARRGPSSVRCS
jgi:hypothetical protein